MSKKRQEQLGRILQQELSSLLQRQGFNIYGKALVTITDVLLSKDLAKARVYLSVYNTDDKAAVLRGIDAHKSELRNELGHAIRNQVRHIPDLDYHLDDSLDRVFRMEEIFKDIKKQDEENKKDADSEE